MTQIKFLCDTVLKQQPVESSKLTDTQKQAVKAGVSYEVQSYATSGDHVKVSFATQSFQGKNTWFVYQPHVVISKGDRIVVPAEVKLKVPYKSQLDNDQDPYGTCNVTSIAMTMAYFGVKPKNPNQQLEDEFHDWIDKKGLDRHSPADLAKLVQAYGHKDRFTTKATIQDVQEWLAQGNPAIVHGYFTQSGHIICLIGYNAKGFIVNDPYGEWWESGYDTSRSGAGLTYSYSMIDRTCRSDGDFWVHFISK